MPWTPRPAISIVVPTHNRPSLLRQALDSIALQTRSDWEVLIVDDASLPAANVPDDIRFRTIRNENTRGGAASKNIGVKHARASVIAFLDDDDLLDCRYLEKALEALDSYPDIDVVFMGIEWFGRHAQNGHDNCATALKNVLSTTLQEARAKHISILERQSLFISLLRSVPMAFQRPVVRKSIFENIGQYQPDILLWDCDWALRAALNARCAILSESLYRQRADGQGYSSQESMRHDQILSNIAMKERLLLTSNEPNLRRAIRLSLSEVWLELAGTHYRNNRYADAMSSWFKSFWLMPRPIQVKYIIRTLLTSVSALKQSRKHTAT